MELLLTTYSSFTIIALVGVIGALLVVQLITSAERRLIAATAILLAGVFFTARQAQPELALVGAACWLAGLGMLVREALAWRPSSASRVGPLAVFFLLPPALFGAILGVGALLSALLAPARLALRLIGP
jgi:hypothetical protein